MEPVYAYLDSVPASWNLLIAAAGLNALCGLVFGYAQCGGINVAAEVFWRCQYRLAADTEANAAWLGALFSAVTVSYLPATFLCGSLMDSVGPRRLLGGAATLAAGGT
eukprot:RCo037194